MSDLSRLVTLDLLLDYQEIRDANRLDVSALGVIGVGDVCREGICHVGSMSFNQGLELFDSFVNWCRGQRNPLTDRRKIWRQRVKFTQHIIVHASDEGALRDLLKEEAAPPRPGLLGVRLHRFRDNPTRYMIQADFDSWDSAERSNERPDTQAWAARLLEVIEGAPKFEDLDVLLELTP